MYHVLVPVDESIERAERQANHVISLPSATSEVEAIVVFVREADYQGAKEIELADVDSAMAALERLEEAGVSSRGELQKGMIARNILDAADDHDADLIVMAGRKRSGVSKVILGSVTQDVILSSERPVTVVG